MGRLISKYLDGNILQPDWESWTQHSWNPEVKRILDNSKKAPTRTKPIKEKPSIGTVLMSVPLAFAGAVERMKDKYVTQPIKRAIEVAMRIDSANNPIHGIKNNITTLWKTDRTRLNNIVDYILTGQKTGKNGYSNSLALDTTPFTGFWTYHVSSPDYYHPEFGDVIDAFLYQTPISPHYRVTRVASNYGPHTEYIKEKYPNKDIPVYQTNEYPSLSDDSIAKQGKWLGLQSDIDLVPEDMQERTSGPIQYNSAGHLVQFGTTKGGRPVYREQDIWKFNPTEYSKKWLNGGNPLTWLGLNIVDNFSTPVVVNTGWRLVPDNADIFSLSNKQVQQAKQQAKEEVAKEWAKKYDVPVNIAERLSALFSGKSAEQLRIEETPIVVRELGDSAFQMFQNAINQRVIEKSKTDFDLARAIQYLQ